MGLLSWLRGDAPLRYGLGDPASYAPKAVSTPWAGDYSLASISVPDDVFGAAAETVTRAAAMSVPTWALARRRVCDGLARFPLVAYSGNLNTRTGNPVAEQPRWLSWSAYYPPRLRMVWTLDDVAHYGWSLWTLDLGAPDQSGRKTILDAARIAFARWDFVQTVDGVRVQVTNADRTTRILEDDEYILFPGTTEGLLSSAAGTLLGAKSLERQWTSRVKNPLPLVELRYTGDEDLEPSELRDTRKVYLEARQDPEGVVMATPRGWEVHAPEVNDVNMFTEGRNAAALDIARAWGISASMLDASQINGSSVDYENNGIGRSEFYDLTWRDWALPIEERLSQDDVVPRGTYVAFDFSSVTTPDTGTGPVLED